MKKGQQLEPWEVALIKRMLVTGGFTKQQIVAYFTRPDRSINQARISEIEAGHPRYKDIELASPEELESFLRDWNMARNSEPSETVRGPTHPTILKELFPLRYEEPPRLNVSETSTVEGKQSFDWGHREKYCRTLAGMANNSGGYLLFGVKDGSFEVVGIAPDRMEKFDLRRANEYITRTFNQALELEKSQFTVAGRTIGVIYVYPSKNKPVICEVDSGQLCSGAIYYRYPGETRQIQAPELSRLLRERDNNAELRALELMKKVIEAGSGNVAVMNLATGEVHGERGSFVVDESLLDKIKFITQGNFEEIEGEPTLRVIGDVVPIARGGTTIHPTVARSISERDIRKAFLDQRCEYDPKVYIEAQAHMQPLWLPIYFFAKEAHLSLEQVIDVIRNSGSPYETRVRKQIERVRSGRAPPGVPAPITVKSEVDALLGDDVIEIDDLGAARRYLQAIRLLKPEQIDLEEVLKFLSDLFARFGNKKELQSEFRYAIATMDLKWFRPELV